MQYSKERVKRDEFSLILMRLRLGLLNEDLAERYGVSVCSYLFTTWINLSSKVLGKALVVWPPKESIREHLSEIFLKLDYRKCPAVIVCAEVFLESCSTWYKSEKPNDKV